MAVHHGKEGKVIFGTTEVGELTGFTLETSADVAESSSLGRAHKIFKPGATSFSGSLEMNFDETDGGQDLIQAGSELTIKVLPEGSESGDIQFTGSVIITGFSFSNSVDGIVSASATYQGAGALTVNNV